MNVFLLLLFINTLLFAAFVCLPSASPWLKGMWEDHKRERERRRELALTKAAVDACMSYTAPADQLIYAESAADAAKLLSEAGRSQTVDDLTRKQGGGGGGLFGGGGGTGDAADMLAAAGWHAPAVRGWPEPLDRLLKRISGPGGTSSPGSKLRWHASGGGIEMADSAVFLHGLKTPSGSPRLVWVFVNVSQILRDSTGEPEDRHYRIETSRAIGALVIDPADPDRHTVSAVRFHEPESARTRITIKPGGEGKKDQLKLEPGGQWRIYAGQADTKDPSRLTIRYAIDGRVGAIDGVLNDGDRLMLTPRTGRLVSWVSGTDYVWDLGAADVAAPATAPSSQPTGK